MSEYKKTSEKELVGGVAPEAKAAFARKPYFKTMGMNIKSRSALR